MQSGEQCIRREHWAAHDNVVDRDAARLFGAEIKIEMGVVRTNTVDERNAFFGAEGVDHIPEGVIGFDRCLAGRCKG